MIYASNQLEARRTLWRDMKIMASSIKGQWMVLGNFNDILTIKDIIGGNLVHESEFADMEEMKSQTSLFEHETKGVHFTWTNKHSSNTLYSRIYKVICNRDWFIAYLNCEIKVLNAHV